MSEVSRRSEACLNCATPLSGQFCHQCGQRDVPPYPSTRELVIDSFWELSGWDGRFLKTVKALVRHPGMLTREFLEGRRARFLSPLRLYLLSSLIYFLLAAASPEIRIGGENVDGITVKPTSGASISNPENVGNTAKASLTNEQMISPEERDSALKRIERAPRPMQGFLKRVILDPSGFRRGILEAMPKMLFVLLPIFAAIVALFYRGLKYPEHLYFAIHLHAFVFLALSMSTLAEFTRNIPIAATVGVIAWLWILVYGTLSFRQVYGGSLLITLAKGVGIATMYAAVGIVALLLTIFVVTLGK